MTKALPAAAWVLTNMAACPRLDQDFTSNTAAVKTAIAGLTAQGGGDTPESAYSGITSALNLNWRPGAKKEVVVFTDADAHDPEPVSGLTAVAVVAHAAAIDPVVINLHNAGAGSNLSGVVSSTGGQNVTGSVADAVTSIIDTSLRSPYAWVGQEYLGAINAPVAFDASGSFDPAGGALKYEWDVNGDGAIDATTSAPSLSWTYHEAYSGLVSVRVTSSAGLSSTATAPITVDRDGDGIPDTLDNCPTLANLGQEDFDRDGIGDVCDSSPFPSGVPGVTVNGGAQHYSFSGFLPPLPKDPAQLYDAAAGSTIPIKWRLTDEAGKPVTAASAVVSYGFDGTGATYALKVGSQFELNAKTPKSWSGTSHTFTLVLDDGSQHTVSVHFK